MNFDPKKFPGLILFSQRDVDEATRFRSNTHTPTPTIDPKRLKSNVLRRIVADAQWDAGRYNQLALAARASCDVEAARDHEFEAEGHRLVARVATQELLDRKEPVR